jgi:hypothetical protein
MGLQGSAQVQPMQLLYLSWLVRRADLRAHQPACSPSAGPAPLPTSPLLQWLERVGGRQRTSCVLPQRTLPTQVLGSTHIDTAVSANALAGLLFERGKATEAASMYER